eukprot:CAMPEP_0185786044 /NCGR_PEP_ID=MMETSP1174-20130828/133139_1 /TAXON_ID=35687 /ORGANISM="Dictyocha speculum, Strain CCMP1381" /LENGTH=76 /DNA_ID=CAMNT_0028478447 /DNA_START=44 /DNA_END=271 /DNA_ORIENTATION=+
MARRHAPRREPTAESFSPEITAIAGLLSKLFTCQSPSAAAKLLSSRAFSPAKRRQLAVLSGIESAWANCDQKITAN